jgi:hypothetical protein
MKLLFLLFVTTVAIASFAYAESKHTIELRTFVVKKSAILPLFDFQQMEREGFRIMAEGDPVLENYKDKFDDIKSVSIYVPEKIKDSETVIIKFKDGDSKIKKVKKYLAFRGLARQRVFSESNFAKLRNESNRRMVQVDATDKAHVSKINF